MPPNRHYPRANAHNQQYSSTSRQTVERNDKPYARQVQQYNANRTQRPHRTRHPIQKYGADGVPFSIVCSQRPNVNIMNVAKYDTEWYQFWDNVNNKRFQCKNAFTICKQLDLYSLFNHHEAGNTQLKLDSSSEFETAIDVIYKMLFETGQSIQVDNKNKESSITDSDRLDLLSESFDAEYALRIGTDEETKSRVKLPILIKPLRNLHVYAQKYNLL
ncbi:hypothetical protein MIR68_010726 [Amoeboaphelidium protococcarum]|nr:hypothetical protein MIR68_010726 [Amoeboaphelidium protococcarum]